MKPYIDNRPMPFLPQGLDKRLVRQPVESNIPSGVYPDFPLAIQVT